MKVDIITPASIWQDERFRTDYGDLDDLVTSIKIYGVIQPLAVANIEGPNKEPFKLLAGGRRYQAVLLAQVEEIPVRIYDEELSELQLRSIELEENVRRKDLTFIEDCNLKREIHNLQVAIHGQKVSTSPNASGHSLRDTAELIGKSHASVVGDIKLANAMTNFPDMPWDKCKNKAEATKMFAKLEEKIIRTDLAEKATKLLGKGPKKLIDSYIVGDFFEKVTKIPDKSIDLVEIDPPYAIDLPKAKKSEGDYGVTYGESYNEIAVEDYIRFMTNTLEQAYRIMNDNSWLIVWFAPEPWFDLMYHMIINAGFKTRRLCGIWTKPGGQTKQPSLYFGNNYEMFYYARKGDAKINLDKQGRGNEFEFSPVNPKDKIHPTERPLDLMEEILSCFAWEGARVVVPFAGSGKTLKAAYNLKMQAIGYDLAKDYKELFKTSILLED